MLESHDSVHTSTHTTESFGCLSDLEEYIQSFIRTGLKKKVSLQTWVMDLLLEGVEMKAKFSPGTRGNKFAPDVEKGQKLQ